MWDTIIVALIIASALAAAGRYIYRILKDQNGGCGTCGTACPTCCAENRPKAPDKK
jgi:Na+-translocating ferredoxin:NAD+ oxidoreductase RNF subunit RnfB